MKVYFSPLYKVNGILKENPFPPSLPEPLFEAEEEDKAQTILKTLDGLSSVEALNLLKKCRMAVLQCKIKVNLD